MGAKIGFYDRFEIMYVYESMALHPLQDAGKTEYG
jgi:hypothetical protein